MKVTLIGEPKVIMSNPTSKFNYFAWPTIATLQNGTIAVAASGFRLEHVCPYGKAVVSYSDDNGETYTLPTPVIDTPLDDRDAGIVPFGKSSVIVTSFNNTVGFQRAWCRSIEDWEHLDAITKEEEEKYLGATFRFSHDCGKTFGPVYISPVVAPHGPVELPDGTLLWIGHWFGVGKYDYGEEFVDAYKVNLDGSMEFVGRIPPIPLGKCAYAYTEPTAVVLDDGRILVHIRVSAPGIAFTVYQSESSDNGKTWTDPVQILPDFGGSPAHLYKHSSGTLISTYGFRGNPYGKKPFGVKVMFSKDNGKTWDIDHILYENMETEDMGYPATTELPDGSLLTVYYARESKDHPAVIMQQRWKFEEN